MTESKPSDAQSRIRDLQTAGRLQEAEATALSQAFATPRDTSPEPSAPTFTPASHRFLSGQMPEEEFRAAGRRASVSMGLHFGILMGVGLGVGLGWGKPLWVMALIGVASAPLLGLPFGWMMFRILIRPAIERQIAFRREAGPVAVIGAADAGQCPSCRAEEFDRWSWHKPTMLHWILNPSLVINELLLGQRIPAGLKICVECKTQVIDCPHCHRAIDGMTWSGRNAFGHWAGLRCPHCDGRLPMLSNALAAVIRAPFQLLARLARLAGFAR